MDLHDGKGFLNAQLYHHKTANRGSLARHRLLPVACVTPAWAGGGKLGRGIPCQGGFDTLPLDPSLGALWLREILKGGSWDDAFPWSDVATRSLKATLLSFMAKAAAPENLRAVAGYHMRSTSSSTLEYSRDTLAPALHFLEGMFLAIKGGVFSPDATRAGRWTLGIRSIEEALRFLSGTHRVDASEPGPPADEPPADPDVPSGPESAAESLGTEGEAEEAAMSVFALGEELHVAPEAAQCHKCFRHKVSGVIHVARGGLPPDEGEMTVFKCGRLANRNYEELSETPAILLTKCSSCWGACD